MPPPAVGDLDDRRPGGLRHGNVDEAVGCARLPLVVVEDGVLGVGQDIDQDVDELALVAEHQQRTGVGPIGDGEVDAVVAHLSLHQLDGVDHRLEDVHRPLGLRGLEEVAEVVDGLRHEGDLVGRPDTTRSITSLVSMPL